MNKTPLSLGWVSMPCIERKSPDRLKVGDMLSSNAGNLLKAGVRITEKNIAEFAKRNIRFVYTISPTHEEEKQNLLDNDSKTLDDTLQDEIEKRSQSRLLNLRERLKENLKTIYLPFNETNRSFHEAGKRKQITLDKLLEKNPGPLYTGDILAGSNAIMDPRVLRYTTEFIGEIYKEINSYSPLTPGTRTKKKALRRLSLESTRVPSYYDQDRLSSVGDALAWHAVDTAIYFLYTMTNINKKRTLEGALLSEARFDPDKKTDIDTKYRYPDEYLTETAIGVALHAIGLSHTSLHSLIPTRHLDKEDAYDQKRRRNLQRNIYVTKHLLDRQDISSLSRMVAVLQHDHPDGTGFPPPNENRTLHEFVRLFQIIDFYDEMTNPVISRTAYSRQDVINYMIEHSGTYQPTKEKYTPQARFDKNLLDEFLQVLAPYSINEKVYLYPEDRHNEHLFVGKTYTYQSSYVPFISIFKDEKKDVAYTDGQLLFNIPKSQAYLIKNKKVEKQITRNWLQKLEIVDRNADTGDISEYEDFLYGEERKLARRLQKKQQ
jgi:hypothetical protein